MDLYSWPTDGAGLGKDSFDIAHNIIAKMGSTVALLAISYLVFLLLPELLSIIDELAAEIKTGKRRCSMKLAKNSTAMGIGAHLSHGCAGRGRNLVLSAVALAGFVFMIFFHRDPDRLPRGEGMLSPADGRIIQATTGQNHHLHESFQCAC